MNNRRLLLATLFAASLTLVGGCGEGAVFASESLTAQGLFEAAGSAGGFIVGRATTRRVVYVFFDTQCPHCSQLWLNSQPLLETLKFVWIPVHVLNASSLAQGATLLSAENPAAAMAEHEKRFATGSRGIAVPWSVPDDAKARVTENTKLFRRSDAESVPFLVFRDEQRGRHATHGGSLSTQQLRLLLGA